MSEGTLREKAQGHLDELRETRFNRMEINLDCGDIAAYMITKAYDYAEQLRREPINMPCPEEVLDAAIKVLDDALGTP